MDWRWLLILLFILLKSSIKGVYGLENPVFTNTTAVTQRLREDLPLGTSIGRVSAYDPDGTSVTYSLESQARNYLEIDPNTGDIKIKVRLDAELSTSLPVVVVATDGNGGITRFVGNYDILDANDNPPYFTESVYNFQLRETTAVGFVIANVSVKDLDTANQANYLNVTCDRSSQRFSRACDVFRVVPVQYSNKDWNGRILLSQSLDFETERSYSLRLNAFDGFYTTVQDMQIIVSDVNDSPPYFVYAPSTTLPENQPAGTYINYVSAVDTDEVDKRPIRYELYGNEEALRYFKIDNVSGNITSIKFLDYEDPSRNPGDNFILQIRARELLSSNPSILGNDTLTTATAEVTVRLQDMNDNCPTFSSSVYNVEVQENYLQGTNIPLQMTVTDADSGSRNSFDLELLDYTTTFAVVPNRGAAQASVTLTVIDSKQLDYETPPTNFIVRVLAKENQVPAQERCSSTATISVTITDVNDETPSFEKTNYEAFVYENATGGTTIIQVKASDRETGDFGTAGIRYRLLSPGNLFTIDQMTGVVSVSDCAQPGKNPCLDYEFRNRYDLTVVATDNRGTGLSRPAALVINVLNVNDNPPRFSLASITRSIDELKVVTNDPLILQATDLDNDTVRYSILYTTRDARQWTVNAVTGNVTATSPVYYTNTSDPNYGYYRFTAIASDGKYETPVDITIKVIDINDNTPFFLPSNYRISIPENYPQDKSILQVSVTDLDAPTTGNGQLDVSIEDGSFGKFYLNPAGSTNNRFILTDIITSPDATFDYDKQNQYILIIYARDRGSPPRTGTCTVTVNILDINNKNPYFDPPTVSVTVSENEPIGYTVTQVNAYDSDATSSLHIQFKDPIRAFNPSGAEVDVNNYNFTDLFRINNDGYVQVNRKLDRDNVSFISYTLFVEDANAATKQTGEGALFIRILEYNDEPPYFEFPSYNLTMFEEQPIGSFVISLLALDANNAIASYQLLSNPGNLFAISAVSGALRVNQRIDYEQVHNVTLIAQAFDTGSPQLQNTAVVYIKIININDNTPVFSPSVYSQSVRENTQPTNPLFVVTATDNDQEDYGIVRYSFPSQEMYLEVDNITGVVRMKPNVYFDREKQSTYSTQIIAYDSPLDPTVRLESSAPVILTILDVNDHCPVFNQPNGYQAIAFETADIGDQVVEVFATDGDDPQSNNSKIKYSIDPSTPSELFVMPENTRRIEIKTSIRGRSGTYNLTVVAEDKMGINDSLDTVCSSKVPVQIRVDRSLNDAPQWLIPPTKNFSIDVLESQYLGMLVYKCKAADPNPQDAGILDYFFLIKDQLVSATNEFRINRVTCVIRAEVVFDREAVSSYVLTIVARDRGTPPASSETTIIVNVLDVNDNNPVFPTRNGATIPYDFYVPENSPSNTLLGRLSATDLDTDNKNNKIFYSIIAGNEDGIFRLNPETGDMYLAKTVDREQKSVYSMEVQASNNVNDDQVIRYRRSTNPSIVTVTVQVQDTNDTPPKFLQQTYSACVPSDAPFGYSIVQVQADDQDLIGGQTMQYSIVDDGSKGYFSIDSTTGILRNARLLYDIPSAVNIIQVKATNDDSVKENSAVTAVNVFVTTSSNEVILQISQPSAIVRAYKDQLIKLMQNSSATGANSLKSACIKDIHDATNADGTISYRSTDVVLSAVGPNNRLYTSDELLAILRGQLASESTSRSYRTLYVTDAKIETQHDESIFNEDPVLAIFIIAILLIFLAIILFIIACCLVRNSKKRKMKKMSAVQYTERKTVPQSPEVVLSVNPVYDNRTFKPDEEPHRPVQKVPSHPVMSPVEPDSDNVYAVVQKKSHSTPPPMVVPAPDVYFPEPQPTEPEPVIVTEPEPVIVTEPIMDDEPVRYIPPAHFHEPEFEPEPVIETEIMPEEKIRPRW
ncbi:cadherin-87A-like isoform X2 [Pomacea canaliculata]|uniref:cadherin-87A-like isoform X2 n=1 Tax=Pomacea canaliculata TaxID=400727 RepID=UPI000D738442|nr:cadherin-87A-like isoform X2 [Pomacea canaliculata]